MTVALSRRKFLGSVAAAAVLTPAVEKVVGYATGDQALFDEINAGLKAQWDNWALCPTRYVVNSEIYKELVNDHISYEEWVTSSILAPNIRI